MSAAVTQSVEALIAEAVSSAVSPEDHNIAALVASELDEETLRELATEALKRSVRRYLRRLDGRDQESSATRGVPRSTRWDLVRQEAASGDLDLARITVSTGEQEKPLLDCMYGDLQLASDNHLRFALANEVFAEQYRDLAELLLENDGARTVGDLPEQRVKAIFSA